MGGPEKTVKENIEIRFFLTPTRARKLLATWRNEKRQLHPYSFEDYYFTKGKSQAKIRRWKSSHVPKTEIIFFQRKSGLKTERGRPATSFRNASEELESLGFRPRLKIVKKKAWLVSKKGMQTYALEFVPGLGWTGEIEVPTKDKKTIPNHLAQLKHWGATDFTKKSMFHLMQERLDMNWLPSRYTHGKVGQLV
jgi:adenylate cyclase class IV